MKCEEKVFRIWPVEQKSPLRLDMVVLLWALEHMLMTYKKQNHMQIR